MAYWSEVKYIDESDPGMINLNSEEFGRIVRVAENALPDLAGLSASTNWDGAGREVYDHKLDDARNLLQFLGNAFAVAAKALGSYVPEIRRAKEGVQEGVALQEQLASLLESYKSGHAGEFGHAEPLRQWEDLRESTGFLDWLSDPLVINHDVERRANQLHDEVHRTFGEAKGIEENARSSCVAALRRAYELLPDYRSDTRQADSVIKHAPGLQQEMTEAANDSDVRLPGMGAVPEYTDGTHISSAVSPALQDLREKAASLPGGNVNWDTMDFARWHAGIGETEEEFRLRWIKDNREVIKTAAAQYGLPADVLAGIAYKEVGGKPMGLDNATDWMRQNLPESMRAGTPVDGVPDQTSYGPMAVQVRRAAEVLDYDPASLSEGQRSEILNSLQNPKENVFIAARYLSNLKQSSDFALLDPGQMTADHGQELAARYNGGPNWEGSQAQDYARDYAAHRAQAAEALK